jgi:hypothetical protein
VPVDRRSGCCTVIAGKRADEKDPSWRVRVCDLNPSIDAVDPASASFGFVTAIPVVTGGMRVFVVDRRIIRLVDRRRDSPTFGVTTLSTEPVGLFVRAMRWLVV